MIKTLTKEKILKALKRLNELLTHSTTLIVGGGGAMLLAHQFPLATMDVDAVVKGVSVDELDSLIKQIAKEQTLPSDWLNTYFSAFTHVLPADYDSRTVNVYKGKKLQVDALGKDDLLLMKCFAHRRKDIPHARSLLRLGANSDKVYDQIDILQKRKIPGTESARDFLDEIMELE